MMNIYLALFTHHTENRILLVIFFAGSTRAAFNISMFTLSSVYKFLNTDVHDWFCDSPCDYNV